MRSPHDPSPSGSPLASADAGTDSRDAPVYVWPLNPWGGYPFQLARS